MNYFNPYINDNIIVKFLTDMMIITKFNSGIIIIKSDLIFYLFTKMIGNYYNSVIFVKAIFQLSAPR